MSIRLVVFAQQVQRCVSTVDPNRPWLITNQILHCLQARAVERAHRLGPDHHCGAGERQDCPFFTRTPRAMRLNTCTPCRPSDASYCEIRERGGEQTEQAIATALQSVARGMSLRQAEKKHAAPFSSLQKAWREMGGQEKTPAWQAFCRSVPPLPPEESTPSPDPETLESPLGPRLTRQATHYGDGVPYGQHGSWGMYREGVKELTTKIAEAKAARAHACP